MALPKRIDSRAFVMFRMVLAEICSLIRQLDQIEAEVKAGGLRRFRHHRQSLIFRTGLVDLQVGIFPKTDEALEV